MKLWRRAAALALVVFASAGAARRADAQGIALIVSPLLADSTTPAPVLSLIASPVPNSVSTVTVELSLDPQFRAPFWARSTQTLQTQFVLDSLLPARTNIYYRARLFDAAGTVRAETTFTHPVRAWLGLVTPSRTTNVLFTRTPTFVWSSPSLTLPPGPWTYDLAVVNVGQNRVELQQHLNDTTFTVAAPLDACTSYRWNVTARAVNGGPNDEITVPSPGSFVIQSAECPQVTLAYQNFPNPFGRGTSSASTCFWFDLAHRSTVRLTIYDIRLRQVRRLVPGALGAVLDSGAYGRQAIDAESGCDPRNAWDGRDDAGRFVPAGVYIAVFEADGKPETKKILYKGP
jgi:hypothetical protein